MGLIDFFDRCHIVEPSFLIIPLFQRKIDLASVSSENTQKNSVCLTCMISKDT